MFMLIMQGFREYLHLRTENEALVAENARLRNQLDRNVEINLFDTTRFYPF